MGYSVGGILQIGRIAKSLDRKLLSRKGQRIIDLGSQDVTLSGEADLRELIRFATEFGADPDRMRAVANGSFPITTSASEVFSAAGFDYVCCDVDRRPGTIYVDFNTLAFDQSLYGQFDLVMNAGTTEHLPNPTAAFFLMHQLCRKNGILYNEVPLSGMLNHGLNNLTPKFWHTMRWMNSYEVLSATVRKIDPALIDPGNFGGDHLDFIQNLAEAGAVSSIIEVIFRKTEGRGFIPPYDAVLPRGDGGEAVARLVAGSLAPFVACGAMSQSAATTSVNAFLKYQSLPHRI